VVLRSAEIEIENVNGLSSMPFNSSMVESLFTEQNEPALGKYDDYEKKVKPFLVQKDTVSCGPIAVLAFHFEYAGRTMFDEVVGSEFETSLRGALLEAYAKINGALEGRKLLVQATGGPRLGAGQLWVRPTGTPRPDT